MYNCTMKGYIAPANGKSDQSKEMDAYEPPVHADVHWRTAVKETRFQRPNISSRYKCDPLIFWCVWWSRRGGVEWKQKNNNKIIIKEEKEEEECGFSSQSISRTWSCGLFMPCKPPTDISPTPSAEYCRTE